MGNNQGKKGWGHVKGWVYFLWWGEGVNVLVCFTWINLHHSIPHFNKWPVLSVICILLAVSICFTCRSHGLCVILFSIH